MRENLIICLKVSSGINLKTQIIDYQSDGFRLSEKQHKFKEVIFENRFEKNNTERCCERIDKII